MRIEVSPETAKLFLKAAEERGIEPAALFEQMILECLSPAQDEDTKGASLHDRYKDVIGRVEGLPSDLSEYPDKYMSDFGKSKG